MGIAAVAVILLSNLSLHLRNMKSVSGFARWGKEPINLVIQVQTKWLREKMKFCFQENYAKKTRGEYMESSSTAWNPLSQLWNLWDLKLGLLGIEIWNWNNCSEKRRSKGAVRGEQVKLAVRTGEWEQSSEKKERRGARGGLQSRKK